MIVFLYNNTVSPSGSQESRVQYRQNLPVTGKTLLETARRTFQYKGHDILLVKPAPTGIEDTLVSPVNGSFMFEKTTYGGRTIYFNLCKKRIRGSIKCQLAERKAYQAANKEKESLDEGNEELMASKVPKNVELPFYNQSKKLGRTFSKNADVEDMLEEY